MPAPTPKQIESVAWLLAGGFVAPDDVTEQIITCVAVQLHCTRETVRACVAALAAPPKAPPAMPAPETHHRHSGESTDPRSVS